MNWNVTEKEVGIPIDPKNFTFEMLEPENQADNNPHFSLARNTKYSFLYISLKELKTRDWPDFQSLSMFAPFMVLIVVETSGAGSVEYWVDGKNEWGIGGAEQIEYEIHGSTPFTKKELIQAYRLNWEEQMNEMGLTPADDYELPQDDEELTRSLFRSRSDIFRERHRL